LRNASDQQITDAMQQVKQIVRDAGISDEKSIVHAALAGGSFEVGQQASRRGARELKASQDTAVAYERQASTSLSEARALRNAASVVTREGFSVTGDDTYAIQQRAAAEGVSRAGMNDPNVMMEVARRHFLETYGASLSGTSGALDPTAPAPTVHELTPPAFASGEVASSGSVQRRGATFHGHISGVNSAEGVAPDGRPTLRDAAGHFVETKQRAQTDIQVHENRLSEDETALHDDRGRRYEKKSLFTNANPGGTPDSEPSLTTQWEFYSGDGAPPGRAP
jgi:hypothetical protein